MKPIFKTLHPLILASGSPRRRDFFEQLGLNFTVVCADIPEEPNSGEGAADYVRRLALAKAEEVVKNHLSAAVVGADTAVVYDGVILGKPADVHEAVDMVLSLSGDWHEVWSGFAVIAPGGAGRVSQAVCTKVRFADVGRDTCKAYGASCDGLDKAGGYGIQSAGAFLVEEIEGSYSNVIGLPLAEVVSQLMKLGIIRSV